MTLFSDTCIALIDPEDLSNITKETRYLGMIIVRGTQVSLVSPEDDMEEIENPFISGDTEE
jgi:U6 snRNA-associated Sm-like protein LSm7